MSEDAPETDHESATVFDRFVDETLAIARQGEGRAGNLDFVGGALIVVAVLWIVGTLFVMGVATGDDTSTGQRIAIGASGVAGAISSLVAAAMVSGFATLVRNSSRSLELLTLDSSLLE